MQVYRDVLNQLVEQHWYDRYLGPDEPRISRVRIQGRLHQADTAGLQQEINRLGQRLLRHPQRQGTVCLLASFTPFLPEWSYYQGEDVLTPAGGQVLAMIRSVAGEATRAAVDSRRTGQAHLRPVDLRLRLARVQPAPAPAPRASGKYDWYLQSCSVGMVSLSRLVFDATRTKCLLAYNFYCGGKCGHGKLLVVEKRGGRWVIVATRLGWIS